MFAVLNRGHRGMYRTSQTLHRDTWDTIMSADVPVSLREIILLAVEHLGLRVDDDNARKLLQCSWRLGRNVKSTTCAGKIRNYRGDRLHGDWVETCYTDVFNGQETSRLSKVICGIEIGNVRKVAGLPNSDERWETLQNKKSDTVFFLLVRYAQPHAQARGRGPDHRPLCPGLLRNTHCLWSWSRRHATFQRGCFRGRAWDRNKELFGSDDQSRNTRRDMESLAWYDFIQVSDITNHANVRPDPDRDNAFLQSVMWC